MLSWLLSRGSSAHYSVNNTSHDSANKGEKNECFSRAGKGTVYTASLPWPNGFLGNNGIPTKSGARQGAVLVLGMRKENINPYIPSPSHERIRTKLLRNEYFSLIDDNLSRGYQKARTLKEGKSGLLGGQEYMQREIKKKKKGGRRISSRGDKRYLPLF